MPPQPNAALVSLQTRLETISMRLDAAADNLLQTRDLFIRHLEQQLLQLQDVRHALHQAAVETAATATQTPVPAPAAGLVKPVGELTLESLFAPLNAAPRMTVPQMVEVDLVEETKVEGESAESSFGSGLFETEPVQGWEPSLPARAESGGSGARAVVLEVVPKTSDPLAADEIDPNLEKATLDELNEALTRAFAQIASRGAAH